MVYEMIIRIVDGKPIVDAITNYEGADAHTEAYKKAHEGDVKKIEEEKS
jgi:hypothetical protein